MYNAKTHQICLSAWATILLLYRNAGYTTAQMGMPEFLANTSVSTPYTRATANSAERTSQAQAELHASCRYVSPLS